MDNCAVLPWWPHTPSKEERVGLKSIAANCRLYIICALPVGCEPPPYVAVDRLERFSPHHFRSQWDYSRLLLSSEFYLRFSAFKVIVIVQSDVLLLRELSAATIRSFAFDYVGAPWVGRDSTGRFFFKNAGNGGLSIRRLESFRRVLTSKLNFDIGKVSNFSARRQPFFRIALLLLGLVKLNVETFAKLMTYFGMHEDTFWARLAPLLHSDFAVADAAAASSFSIEREPRFVIRFAGSDGPIGAHAWLKHGDGYFDDVAIRIIAGEATEPQDKNSIRGDS